VLVPLPLALALALATWIDDGVVLSCVDE